MATTIHPSHFTPEGMIRMLKHETDDIAFIVNYTYVEPDDLRDAINLIDDITHSVREFADYVARSL